VAVYTNDPKSPTKGHVDIALQSPDLLLMLPKLGSGTSVLDEEHYPEPVELLDMLAITLKMYDDNHILAGRAYAAETLLWSRCVRDMLLRGNHQLNSGYFHQATPVTPGSAVEQEIPF